MDDHGILGVNGGHPLVGFTVTAREFQFNITLYNHQTVLDMKQEIQEFVNVEPERQTLMHRNRELRDDRVLSFYGFGIVGNVDDEDEDEDEDGDEDGDEDEDGMVPIRMIAAPAENENLLQDFTVMLSNYSVLVSGATTVAELKTLITQNLGIPAGSFEVHRIGQKMEDHRTLYDYHVGPEAEVTIVRN